ncbi:hypothetical protein FRB90_005251, partial [Tulasnella sp. 427]
CGDERFEYERVTRDLTPANWTRFRLYAPFIRKLKITVSLDNYDTLIQLCMHSNGRLLLPHLEEISIEFGFSEGDLVSAQESQEIFEALLGPSLKTIECRHVGQGDAPNEMALPFFDRLHGASSLQTLRWEGNSIPPSAEASLSSFLSKPAQLHSIEIQTSNLSSAIVQPAAQIPTLAAAIFSKFQDGESQRASPSFFASLEELECYGTNTGVNAALQQISAPQLASLIISVTRGSQAIRDPGLLGSLRNRSSFPALTALQLNDYVPSEEDLQTISSLKNLRRLSLVPTLTNLEQFFWPARAVLQLSQSLPKLEELVLDNGYGSSVDEAISLPELECFARHCPNLKRLEVSVDARWTPDFQRPLHSHSGLEQADIIGCWEADEHGLETAQVIHQLWPNLTEEFLIKKVSSEIDALYWRNIWEEVLRLRRIKATEALSRWLCI